MWTEKLSWILKGSAGGDKSAITDAVEAADGARQALMGMGNKLLGEQTDQV